MCQEDDEETGMLSIHLLLSAGDGAQAAPDSSRKLIVPPLQRPLTFWPFAGPVRE